MRGTRAIVVAVTWAGLVACAKKDQGSGSPEPVSVGVSSATPVPAVPPRSYAGCTRFVQDQCAKPDTTASFFFTGEYIDAKCTQPVAHADVMACRSVPKVTGVAKIYLAETMGRAKENEQPAMTLVRQLAPVQPLFHKATSGRCESYVMTGMKLAPVGCEKVCRGADGLECCQDVTCPNVEGSRVLVLVAESSN
jgi:hypothetical protein